MGFFFIAEAYNKIIVAVSAVFMFVGLILVTLILSALLKRIIRYIPRILLMKPIITTIKETTEGVRRYTLVAKSFFHRSSKSTYTLEGRVVNGEIDGTIAWVDNEPLGETLTGEWRGGMLVGLSVSSVIGQRSLIRTVPIVSFDYSFDQGRANYVYSLNSVECCYSGNMLYVC